jgi:hypothetical protein
MTYQKKVKGIIEERNLALDIAPDGLGGITIYVDAPTGFTMDGDLHGYVAHGYTGEKRESLWQDLYNRLKDGDLHECMCETCEEALEEESSG